MQWKERLEIFENNKDWDLAIEYMQNIVANNPHDLDAYLSINYLLMNLLVEEDYDETKHDYYAYLTKRYFDESYAKFSDNAEYLFYIARIAAMSEWYFDIDIKDVNKMLQKAMFLDPQNPIYKLTYYRNLDEKNPQDKEQIIDYAKLVLQPNSPIKKILENKGSLGKYLLDIMSNWSMEILASDKSCDHLS